MRGRLKDDPDNGVPGPGAYTETIKSSGPKYTLGKSDRPKELFLNVEEGSQFYGQSTDGIRSSFPGPGQYQIDSGYSQIKPKTQSVVLSKTKKDMDYDNKVPGPGAYENDGTKVQKSNPMYSLGKTNREDPFMPEKDKKALESIPGPGNYNFNSSIGTGRKVFNIY